MQIVLRSARMRWTSCLVVVLLLLVLASGEGMRRRTKRLRNNMEDVLTRDCR